MCEFYGTHKAKSCREPIADEVKDKERANFCDYFSLKPDAFSAKDVDAQEQAKQQLDTLFGGDKISAPETDTPQSKEQATREALEDLFKK